MTAAQAIRIGLICDRFEWGWRKGERPQIEDVLSLAAPEDRSQLLEDLLRIELEMRPLFGDVHSAPDYTKRFPEEIVLIERILRETDRGNDPPSRRSVGRCDLLEEIGRGRQGVVFRAIEEGLAPLEVAIKLLDAGAVGSPDDARRFIIEVEALARVSHKHIVPFLRSGDDRGQLYYVMKYMSGPSLERFLRQNGARLSPDEAVRILVPIVQAAKYLHGQRIVHRDLKPGNILMDEAGEPYVADFGLALLLEGDCVEGGAFGTIHYIAPEQLDVRYGEVGPKSDVYSLGVILYELLAGEPPFPRNRESILRTLDAEPIAPSRIRDGIPDELERICLKCLRKATRDRYDSTQLAEDLDHFQRREPLVHAPPDSIGRRLRHDARSEPALYARLAVIIACSTILWGYRLIAGRFVPLPAEHWGKRVNWSGIFGWHGSVELIIVLMNQAILVAWGLISLTFQRRLNRDRHDGGLQFGWRIVDVVALSLLIEFDDALMSPLTVAFAVLIVASAFWARADQILQTTLLSMTGYAVLAVIDTSNHPTPDHSYRHFHYLVGLACLGAMLIRQANHTQALARICGPRKQA